jgi:hypothetical protein
MNMTSGIQIPGWGCQDRKIRTGQPEKKKTRWKRIIPRAIFPPTRLYIRPSPIRPTFLPPSLHLSIPLSILPSFPYCTSPIHAFIHLSIHHFICPSIQPYIYSMSICPRMRDDQTRSDQNQTSLFLANQFNITFSTANMSPTIKDGELYFL